MYVCFFGIVRSHVYIYCILCIAKKKKLVKSRVLIFTMNNRNISSKKNLILTVDDRLQLKHLWFYQIFHNFIGNNSMNSFVSRSMKIAKKKFFWKMAKISENNWRKSKTSIRSKKITNRIEYLLLSDIQRMLWFH